MYQYTFVEARSEGVFRREDYKDKIESYSKEGWRFVNAIPKRFTAYGIVKAFDLVFEKEVKEE